MTVEWSRSSVRWMASMHSQSKLLASRSRGPSSGVLNHTQNSYSQSNGWSIPPVFFWSVGVQNQPTARDHCFPQQQKKGLFADDMFDETVKKYVINMDVANNFTTFDCPCQTINVMDVENHGQHPLETFPRIPRKNLHTDCLLMLDLI